MGIFQKHECIKIVLLYTLLPLSIWVINSGGCLYAQFNFIHITDLHVSDASSYVNGCDLNGEIAECYLNEFANLVPKPAFIVASGDIANIGENNSANMYYSLTQYLYPPQTYFPGPGQYFIDSAQTIPIYFTPGNHDYYSTLIPPLSSSTFTHYPIYLAPDTDYVATYDSAVIVLMRSGKDAMRPIWEDPNVTTLEGSGLSNDQCTWLRQMLSIAGNKRKIIVMHHPTIDVAGTNWDGTPYTGTIYDAADGSIINNRNTFMNICDSNNVDIVLTGHKHQNVVALRSENVVGENWHTGTRYIQTGTALDHTYRIITVTASFVYVSTPLLSCIPIAVAESSHPESILIYPNPCNGLFKIIGLRDQMESIEIYNVYGEKVYFGNLKQKSVIEIDISKFGKGMFFLNMYDKKRTYKRKVILN